MNIFRTSKNTQLDRCCIDEQSSVIPSPTGSESLPVNISDKELKTLSKLRSLGENATKIGEYWVENKRINANIKVLKIQTNAALQRHAQYMMAMQNIATKAFAERHIALSKQYEALERGMDTNDREIIITALQCIADIVVKNPLEDLAKLAYVLKNPSQNLELDF
ncbi:MAG: hypothetical protein K2M53_02895 [Muribaculaceae bacterium]|nr:hypothetical protein [Muribaculaceae bacterium]